MTQELFAVVKPFIERIHARLVDTARSDPVFRDQLGALGEYLSALVAGAAPVPPSPAEQPVGSGQESGVGGQADGLLTPDASLPTPERSAEHVSAGGAPPGPSIHELAARLRFDGPPAPQPSPVRTFAESGTDLLTLAARCRLKAEAARWAAGGRDPMVVGDLIARAKPVPGCYLAACRRDRRPVAAGLDRIAADCYDAAALAAELAHDLTADDPPRPALDLIAEAQSALRSAVAATGEDEDRDQVGLYCWLRDEVRDRGVYIDRYMKIDDAADPATASGLADRLVRELAALRARRQAGKEVRKRLKQIAFHAGRVRKSPAEDHADDWRTILRAVNELVAGGLPPSHAELRDLLLPVLDDLPEDADLTDHHRRVLREIDRSLAAAPPATAPAAPEEPTEEVRRARELLNGRAVVLIGGTPRRPAGAALQAAFGLSELVWVETRDHQTHTVFEPVVADPAVAVVVLAVRWSNHGFGEVKEFCDKYGKPLVRLPAGYNPNQVARHILTQVGGRLVAAAGRATGPGEPRRAARAWPADRTAGRSPAAGGADTNLVQSAK